MLKGWRDKSSGFTTGILYMHISTKTQRKIFVIRQCSKSASPQKPVEHWCLSGVWDWTWGEKTGWAHSPIYGQVDQGQQCSRMGDSSLPLEAIVRIFSPPPHRLVWSGSAAWFMFKVASIHRGKWWPLGLTCLSSSSLAFPHCRLSLPLVTIATMTMRTYLLSRRWNGRESGGWPTMLGSACVCGTSMRLSRNWAGCVRCTWRVTNLRLSYWSCIRPWLSSWVWSSKSEVSVKGSWSVMYFNIPKRISQKLSRSLCWSSYISFKWHHSVTRCKYISWLIWVNIYAADAGFIIRQKIPKEATNIPLCFFPQSETWTQRQPVWSVAKRRRSQWHQMGPHSHSPPHTTPPPPWVMDQTP